MFLPYQAHIIHNNIYVKTVAPLFETLAVRSVGQVRRRLFNLNSLTLADIHTHLRQTVAPFIHQNQAAIQPGQPFSKRHACSAEISGEGLAVNVQRYYSHRTMIK